MMKPLLMASVAAGLIVPDKPVPFVPPKPAIVRAANLEASRHLLAIPLPIGIPASMARLPPSYLSVTGSAASTTAASYSWTHTVESNATCLVVVFACTSSVAMGTASCTVNGSSVSATVTSLYTAEYRCIVFCLFNPPTGAVSIVCSVSGTLNRLGAAHSITVAGASSINASGTATGTSTGTVNLTTTSKTLIVGGALASGSGSISVSNTMTAPTGSTVLREANAVYINRRTSSAYKTLVQDAGSVAVTCTPTGLSTPSTALALCAVALAA